MSDITRKRLEPNEFLRCVAIKIAFWLRNRCEDLFLGLFLVLLGEQDSLDVWQHTTGGDGNTRQKFVQFFVVADSELKMSWNNSCFLVVTGSVTSQLQDFSRQVFEDGSQVYWCAGSDSVGIVSLSEKSVNTSNGELKSSPERSSL